MLLAIDVGNSATKAALFEGKRFVDHCSWPTHGDPRIDRWLPEFLKERKPDGCVVASVVPSLDLSFLSGACAFVQLHAGLDLGLKIRYDNPLGLGADRLANVLGALSVGKPPLIVLDAGTATKLEAIGPSGDYLGGAILPGLRMGAKALAAGTEKLPPIEPAVPPKAIGTSTAAALQSGVVLGHVGAIEGLIARFQAEIGSRAKVVATGGALPALVPALGVEVRQEPRLTLMGLQEAASRLGLG